VYICSNKSLGFQLCRINSVSNILLVTTESVRTLRHGRIASESSYRLKEFSWGHIYIADLGKVHYVLLPTLNYFKRNVSYFCIYLICGVTVNFSCLLLTFEMTCLWVTTRASIKQQSTFLPKISVEKVWTNNTNRKTCKALHVSNNHAVLLGFDAEILIWLPIDWLISIWIQDLIVPMYLDLN